MPNVMWHRMIHRRPAPLVTDHHVSGEAGFTPVVLLSLGALDRARIIFLNPWEALFRSSNMTRVNFCESEPDPLKNVICFPKGHS